MSDKEMMDALADLNPVPRTGSASASDPGLRAVLSSPMADDAATPLGDPGSTPGAIALNRGGRRARPALPWIIGVLVLALGLGSLAVMAATGVFTRQGDRGLSPLVAAPVSGTVLRYAGYTVTTYRDSPDWSCPPNASCFNTQAPDAARSTDDSDSPIPSDWTYTDMPYTDAPIDNVPNPTGPFTWTPAYGTPQVITPPASGLMQVAVDSDGVASTTTYGPGDAINMGGGDGGEAILVGPVQTSPVQTGTPGPDVMPPSANPTWPPVEGGNPSDQVTIAQQAALSLSVEFDAGTLRIDTSRCLVDGTGSYTMKDDGSWSFDPGSLRDTACPGGQAGSDFGALLDTLSEATRWGYTTSDPTMPGSYYTFTGRYSTVYLAAPDSSWPAFGTLAPKPGIGATVQDQGELNGTWQVAEVADNSGTMQRVSYDWTVPISVGGGSNGASGGLLGLPPGCYTGPGDAFVLTADGRWFFGAEHPNIAASCGADTAAESSRVYDAMVAATNWATGPVQQGAQGQPTQNGTYLLLYAQTVSGTRAVALLERGVDTSQMGQTWADELLSQLRALASAHPSQTPVSDEQAAQSAAASAATAAASAAAGATTTIPGAAGRPTTITPTTITLSPQSGNSAASVGGVISYEVQAPAEATPSS